jgi:hypothetical protein
MSSNLHPQHPTDFISAPSPLPQHRPCTNAQSAAPSHSPLLLISIRPAPALPLHTPSNVLSKGSVIAVFVEAQGRARTKERFGRFAAGRSIDGGGGGDVRGEVAAEEDGDEDDCGSGEASEEPEKGGEKENALPPSPAPFFQLMR